MNLTTVFYLADCPREKRSKRVHETLPCRAARRSGNFSLAEFFTGCGRLFEGASMPTGDGKTPQQRFAERYIIDPVTGCWNWTAGKNSYGYGYIQVNGRATPAHRFSYTLLRGTIPEGLTIDHLCRNRKCVNPAHLEPVSKIENVMRGIGVGAINAKRTECPKGHPLSGDNLCIKKNGRRRCKACMRIEWTSANKKRSMRQKVKIEKGDA